MCPVAAWLPGAPATPLPKRNAHSGGSAGLLAGPAEAGRTAAGRCRAGRWPPGTGPGARPPGQHSGGCLLPRSPVHHHFICFFPSSGGRTHARDCLLLARRAARSPPPVRPRLLPQGGPRGPYLDLLGILRGAQACACGGRQLPSPAPGPPPGEGRNSPPSPPCRPRNPVTAWVTRAGPGAGLAALRP